MANDPRTSSHSLVVGPPYVRSYAGVPLLNHSGFAIGTVAILDDQPRTQELTDPEIQFMQDIAASVMNHLDMKRIQASHDRGLRLVRGLSRFIEGKDSIDADEIAKDSDDPEALKKRQTTQSSGLKASSRTEAMNTASNAERMYDAKEAQFHRGTSKVGERPTNIKSPLPESTAGASSQPLKGPSSGTEGGVELPMRPQTASRTSSQLQEDMVSRDVPEAFNRAAKILQQAMKLDTVLFLDASAGAFGSLRSNKVEDVASQHSDSSSASTAGGETDTASQAGKSSARKDCRYLSRAYSAASERAAEAGQGHGNIPEKFLRSVLKRFSHGKIYNFGDDDLITSSDFSDGVQSPDTTTDREKHLRLRKSDSTRLRKIFPGVRCVGVMPMYDSIRGRFYAGAVVVSYDTQRLFSFQEDMNYLGAFCDVVMAEVGRLDVQADVQAKTSFISSISHELRSPLHGILGGVECLQDATATEPVRAEMMQMIDTCGRSLLDIINNLLDHSHVRTSAKSSTDTLSRRRRARKDAGSSQAVHDLTVLTEEVLNSALWSTPRPTRRSLSSKTPSSGLRQLPLKVALDIDSSNLPETGWLFRVNSGAWRRILQNLTSNAIKYTDEGGFFRVCLSVGEAREDAQSRIVTLRCSDSGRGISKEYLKSGLWQAFNQEDSHAQGTGLGLSLVHGLVQGNGGNIDVKSDQGVGTTITVSLPLVPGAVVSDEGFSKPDNARTRGTTYRTLGFEESVDHSQRAADSMKVLNASVRSLCHSLGLVAADDDTEPDVYIITEEAALLVKGEGQPFQRKPTIVVCDSITSARTTSKLYTGSLSVPQFVSQPLGPRRLLKALTACLHGVKHDLDTPDERSLSPEFTSSSEIGSPTVDITPSKAEESAAAMVAVPSTVLVVDDNSVNLMLLQRYMMRLGRPQIGATDGQEAVDAYKANGKSISIIFMDITMPVLDGLQASRLIRDYERSSGTERAMIIALTAMASPSAKQEAYSSGIDLFLTKPVQFRQIEGLFKEWDERDEKRDLSSRSRRPSSIRGNTA